MKIANELLLDFKIIAISTSLKDYKLCYYLNQILDTNLQRLDDLNMDSKDKTRKIKIPVFKASKGTELVNYLLFANKVQGEYFLAELSDFDFVLKVEGDIAKPFITELVKRIKQVIGITIATEVSLKKIKSPQKLHVEEPQSTQKLIITKRHRPT